MPNRPNNQTALNDGESQFRSIPQSRHPKADDNWLDEALLKVLKDHPNIQPADYNFLSLPKMVEAKALITQKLREAELRGIEAYRTLILDWARQFHPELLVELEAQLKTVRSK